MFGPLNPLLSSQGEVPEGIAKGVILSVNRDAGTYDVKAENSPALLEGCRWAVGGIFAPLFGVSMVGLLEEGTRVLVMLGNPHYIVHALPSGRPQSKGAANGGHVGDGRSAAEGLGDKSPPEAFSGTNLPRDLVEGEFHIGNALGAGVSFLLNMVRVGAGRAFIEACLLDDTVRLVSKGLSMHTAVGDIQHTDDGRLNLIESFSSYNHEAWGKLTPEQARMRVAAGKAEAPTEEELRATGRWRYEKFCGFLGDFIHQWVMQPEETLGSLAAQGVRSATSHHWQGGDGSLLWQSVGEIALERVVAIPVPRRTPGAEGVDNPPGGEAYYKTLEQNFLKIWDRGIDQTNTHQTAFQIREYARWLSQFVALARFHQQPGKWAVPSEQATPPPMATAGEQDKEQANGGPTYVYRTYATIRILRDGGIMALEGNGASFILSGGRAWISAPYDLNIEAGGDIRMTSGRDIWIKARRNLSVTSVVGALALKARTSFRALCEKGSLWLKSDARATETYNGTPPDAPAREYGGAAVIIEASQDHTLVTSAKQTVIEGRGTGNTDGDDNTRGGVVIQAPAGSTYIHGNRSLVLDSKYNLDIRSDIALYLRAFRSIVDIRSRSLELPGIARLSAGNLTLTGSIYARSVVASNGFVGPSDRVGKNTNLEDPNPSWQTPPSPSPATAFSYVPPARVAWSFPPVALVAQHPVMETLSQQYMRLETPHAADPEAPLFGVWNQANDKLVTAPGTNQDSAPYPGAAQHLTASGASLRVPSGTEPKDIPAPSPLTAQNIQTRYVSDATS